MLRNATAHLRQRPGSSAVILLRGLLLPLFNGVRALGEAGDVFASERNERAAPFLRVKAADHFIAIAIRKTKEYCEVSYHQAGFGR